MPQPSVKFFFARVAQSPWVALCFVMLFGAGVLVFEMRNLKSESTFITTLTTEKGNAFITVFENALRTEVGLHWADNTLYTLLKSLGLDKNLHFLAIADAGGNVLLKTGDLPDNVRLWDTPPPIELTGAEVSLQDERHFRVSRRIHIDSNVPHIDGQHMGVHESLQTVGNAPLWAVADYSMQQVADARSADRLHLVVIVVVLLFLMLFWGVTFYLARRHARSKQLVQETTAFSSHILRNLPMGIIATDTDYTITSINAEAARIIGMSTTCAASLLSPALAYGSGVRARAARRLPSVWDPVMTSLRAGPPIRDVEMRCSFEDEKPISLSVSASSLVTDKGQQLGYVFMVRDLGEIRHLQAELRRRDRLAALGTLAAGIAHEVRNPLSAIRGIARYFEECHLVGSEEGELSKVLEQEVLRLDKVVSNLLDLARSDTLQCVPVSLDALVERARRMAAPTMEQYGVEFALQLPTPSPVVLVDGDRLTQVLINLFLNAVDAMRQSEQRLLSVRAELEKDEVDTWLVVEVEDTGSGIPPEKMQDIFSPYYTTKPRGTGLGLPIVHKIVEAHEGTIAARNSRHGGCIMTLRLPLPLAHKV